MHKIFLVLMAGILLLANNAGATKYLEYRIAVINVQELNNKSKGFQDILTSFESGKRTLQERASFINEDMQNKFDNLKRKQSVLSKIEYEKQERNLKEEIYKSGLQLDNDKKKFEAEYIMGLEIYEKNLKEIIDDYARKNNYYIILNSIALPYYDTSLDVTSHIVNKLNKILPKIEIR